MILSFSFQCKLFFMTIGLGLLSAFLYHIFYILAKTIKLNKIIKGLIDLVYWFVLALSLFLIMLKLNNGEVRPFTLLGIALGMTFYLSLIKKPMDRLIYPLFKIIAKVFLLIITIILTPIRLVLYPILKILLEIVHFVKKLLKKYVKYEKINLYQKGKHFMGVNKLTTAAKTIKKKNSKINILWAVIMIIMICIFAVALCYEYVVHLQLNTARQEIEVQIAEAKTESAALTKQYENQDSPEFIEKVAREKLNMVYPSELVYINSNSDEGKKLLNSIKRSTIKANTPKETTDNSVSTRVE